MLTTPQASGGGRGRTSPKNKHDFSTTWNELTGASRMCMQDISHVDGFWKSRLALPLLAFDAPPFGFWATKSVSLALPKTR